MIKRRIPTMFFVEPSPYGWAVRAGDERLGLFVTQRQALQDVRTRRADLKSNGQHSTLVVTGSDTEAGVRTALRPFRR